MGEGRAHQDSGQEQHASRDRQLGRQRTRQMGVEAIPNPGIEGRGVPQDEDTDEIDRAGGDQERSQGAPEPANRCPPLIERRAASGPQQKDSQHGREAVDGVLQDLARHPDHDHLVADAQESGDEQRDRQGPR